jgi:hypothetical protein
MIMPPRLRKMVLAVHVASSVGWLGAAACFLALAVVGLTSQDAPTVRTTSLVLWLGATVLSVYRPHGMTRYGSASSVPTGTSILRCRRSSRTDARPGSMFELEVGSGR